MNNEIPRNAQLDGKHLTLNNVKFEDAGRYVCNMRYPNGSAAEDYVDVIIKREYRSRRHPQRWRANRKTKI